MKNNAPKKDSNNNFFNKNPLITFTIFSIVIIMLFKVFVGESNQSFSQFGNTKSKELSYSDFKKYIANRQITEVALSQNFIKAHGKEGNKDYIFTIRRISPDNSLIPLLEKNGVKYKGFSETNWFTEMIGWMLPIFLIMGIWMFMANRMQNKMGGGILGMGSSKKLVNSEKPTITFDDVAGVDEAKEEVIEIVDFLKYPDRYINLGAKIPKGVLLVGSPGTGKTLLAKAVAGEAEVPFFSVSGSSFIEMFVGVGAARVRDLFNQAKKDAPSIVFIDEIDAIGKSRAANGNMGGNDEREQTLNQLLAEMDGFSTNIPVIILAATNRPEVLDPALLRPGRFDRQVLVDKPDFDGRVKILKVHIEGIKLDKDIELEEIARLTAGLAGADLANIINEAALLAGRREKKKVTQLELRESVERAIAGLEKKSRRINPKEKRIVAYHESGHALIAEITKGAKRVSKVSIIPRGLAALGYTLNTPEENKYLAQKYELYAEIDVLLAGRAAEEIFIGEISTGASNDLERATDILKSIVQVYGMSNVAGLMVLEKQRSTFLGTNYGQGREYSEQMAQNMDSFIKSELQKHYENVLRKLKLYKGAIEKMVIELHDKESVSGKFVRKLITNFEKDNNLPSLVVSVKEDKENSISKPKEDQVDV